MKIQVTLQASGLAVILYLTCIRHCGSSPPCLSCLEPRLRAFASQELAPEGGLWAGVPGPRLPSQPPTVRSLVFTKVDTSPHPPELPAASWKGVRAPQRAGTHTTGSGIPHRDLRVAPPRETRPGWLRALWGPGPQKGLQVTQEVTHDLITVPSPSGCLLRKRPPPPWIPPTAVVTRWVPCGPHPPALAFLPSSPPTWGWRSLVPVCPSLGCSGQGPRRVLMGSERPTGCRLVG